MTENQRKLLLYLQPWNNYWKLTDPKEQNYFKEVDLGFYPLSFKDRIAQGHYTHFDKEGVPCFPNKHGIIVHHYTTMASYALGNWELYLLNGKEEYLQNLIKVADYMLITGEEDGDVVLFLDYEDESESSGSPCAMNQGEAASVLCRAYSATENIAYLDKAKRAVAAFKYPYGNRGVSHAFSGGKSIWFKEGGKFILNGHIYSMFGILDLFLVSQDEEYKALFDSGTRALLDNIASFDTRYWSWYWLDEPRYIASMMYHNLHICQLMALYQITGLEEFAVSASTFRNYARSPINRFRSGYQLLMAKLT